MLHLVEARDVLGAKVGDGVLVGVVADGLGVEVGVVIAKRVRHCAGKSQMSRKGGANESGEKSRET